MALGCACIVSIPRHIIEAKQNNESGEGDEYISPTYYPGTIGSRTINSDEAGKGEPTKSPEDAGVEVVEYYGKVPRELLEASESESSTETIDTNDIDESDLDRKSTRLNSSHQIISYAVFCLKKKK